MRVMLLTVAGGFDLGYRQYLIPAALNERDQADTERLINFYMAEVVSSADVMTDLA